MKTSKFIIAAMAVVAATSCVKNLNENTSGDVPVVASFSAERAALKVAGQNNEAASEETATKTVLAAGNKVEWTAGDKVGLSYADYYGASTQPTGEGKWLKTIEFIAASAGTKSVFTTTNDQFSADKDLYVMIYPRGDYQMLFKDGIKIRSFIDDDQTATSGSFVPSAGIAVAKSSTLSEPVEFRNVMALLKFTITDELAGQVKQIAVTGANEETLGGNFFIDYSDDTPVLTPATSMDVYTEMRLTSASGMAAGNYYLAVLPGQVSNLTVEVTLSDGSVISRTSASTAGYALQSGYIYNMGEVTADNYTSTVTGIESLPYVFSLNTPSSNKDDMLYCDVTVSGSNTSTYDMYYYDKVVSGAYLHCRQSGSSSSKANTNPIYNNPFGLHNIPGKSFIKGQDNFYTLAVPLNCDLPSSFGIIFGLHEDKSVGSWKVQYSKDNSSWTYIYNVKNSSNNVWQIYTLNVTGASFRKGDVLYIRMIPDGSTYLGSATSAWGGVVRIWGGIALTDMTVQNTSVPSDALYFEAFDDCVGGVDYLNQSVKLGILTNAFGADALKVLEGYTGNNVVMRPGYVQIGHPAATQNYNTTFSNTIGKLVTPTLGTSGALELSFKAVAYLSPKEPTITTTPQDGTEASSIVVNILGGGTFDDGTSTKTVTVSTDRWDTLTYSISGATEATQIEFTSPSSATTTRWFLDEICVKAK